MLIIFAFTCVTYRLMFAVTDREAAVRSILHVIYSEVGLVRSYHPHCFIMQFVILTVKIWGLEFRVLSWGIFNISVGLNGAVWFRTRSHLKHEFESFVGIILCDFWLWDSDPLRFFKSNAQLIVCCRRQCIIMILEGVNRTGELLIQWWHRVISRVLDESESFDVELAPSSSDAHNSRHRSNKATHIADAAAAAAACN